MPKGMKVDQEPKYWDRLFASPGILGIITTVDIDGKVNAASFGTIVRVVHNPVQIAFTTNSKGKDTYGNVLATGQFVVNLPSFERDILEKVCIVGLPFAPGVNELEKSWPYSNSVACSQTAAGQRMPTKFRVRASLDQGMAEPSDNRRKCCCGLSRRRLRG